jgi:hypothetical protein
MAGASLPRLRIVVEVDPLSAPLEGTLRSSSAARREFVGLVELLAAFEDVVRQAQERDNPEGEADRRYS